MVKYLKLASRTSLAFLLAMFVALIFVQEDPWFKNIIEQKLNRIFSQCLGSECLFKIKKINLLSGQIIFDEINTKDSDQNWSFASPTFSLNFSWIGLFARQRLESDITFYRAFGTSKIKQNRLAIIEPVIAIIDLPDGIPFKLKKLSFRNSSFELQDKQPKNVVKLFFSSDTVFRKATIDTNVAVADGFMKYNDQVYAQKISGNVMVNSPYSVLIWDINGRLVSDVPQWPKAEQRCILFGTYKKDHGSFEIHSNDHAFIAKAFNMKFVDNHLTMDLQLESSLDKLGQLGHLNINKYLDGGKILALAQVDLAKNTIKYSGNCFIEQMSSGYWMLPKCTLKAEGDADFITGSYDITDKNYMQAGGTFKWDINNAHFMSELKAQKLSKEPDDKTDARCKLEIKNNEISANYSTQFSYTNNNTAKCSGDLSFDQKGIKIEGALNDMPYRFLLSPESGAAIFTFKDTQNNYLINLNKKENSQLLQISIDLNLLKGLMRKMWDFELIGEGKILINGRLKNNKLMGKVGLKDASIKIPHTFNLIKNGSALFKLDLGSGTLTVRKMAIQLYKGIVNSIYSTLKFAPNGQLLYAHVPLTCHDCLVSWQKEFFGSISGQLIGVYNKNGDSSCKGELILDSSQLRGNLFSSQLQQDLVSSAVRSLMTYKKDMNLDITLSSKKELEVKTQFLETNAQLQLALKGTLFHPELSGIIQLTQGILSFPYKPLYITHGKIYLMAHQLDDPIIELTAKNKIKKYTITLSITGSLKHPKISFSASDGLPEEQIIMLLLTGSEEGSLSLLMPNLIMQNLESLIFGPADSSSQFQKYIKNLLKPLKNIRFLAETGTDSKGLRGGIEFDINDRLRAKIQNNLNLSEDSQFEIEYTLSDDMSIKAIKDERGALGADVEMRWKF